MNVALRAKAVLTAPARAWSEIESEPGDAAEVLSGYVAPLALLPALSGFIGACLVGVAVPGIGVVRAPVLDGLFGAILGFVMTCATVLVLALVIRLLAPLFDARRDFDSAFKLAVYSYTPVWLAGVFLLAPGLRFIALTAVYGAYILWVGLPVLMESPSAKAPAYTAAVTVCACALTLLAGAAQHALFGIGGL